jgi:hypothetical protein
MASRNSATRSTCGELALAEGAVAVLELCADPRHARRRYLPQAGLLAERLDIAHREPAHERPDHQRLQRLRRQEALRLPREQLRRERLGCLAQLRDLELELTLRRLQPARAPAVALAGQGVRSALVALATEEGVELLLDGALDDQLGAQVASSESAPCASLACKPPASSSSIWC